MTPSTAQQVATLTRAIRAVRSCGLRAKNESFRSQVLLSVHDGDRCLGFVETAIDWMEAFPLEARPFLDEDREQLEAVCAAYEEGR